MQVYCTRSTCSYSENSIPILSGPPPKFCISCGMNLLLNNQFMAIDKLADGGFGKLFIGVDTHNNHHQCVIKQLKIDPQLTDYEKRKSKELFEREAEVLKVLGNHQQIPRLYASFSLINNREEFSYIVEEYVDGENLEQIQQKQGKLTENEIIDLLRQTLPILQFIHEQGYIHRDLKPSNLKRNSQGVIYLLDFGAVKKLENHPSANQVNLTPNTRIYTAGYAPLEQQLGATLFPSTDLYALGVTCLVLLTGKNPDQIYDSHSNSWQWQRYIKVNYLLETVLNKMVESPPEKRFSSAIEVLDALSLLINKTIVTTPPDPAPKLPKKPTLWKKNLKKSFIKPILSGGVGSLIASILLKIFASNLLPLIIFFWLILYVPIVWSINYYDSLSDKITCFIFGTVATILGFYVWSSYIVVGSSFLSLPLSWFLIFIIIASLLNITMILIYQLFNNEQ